MTEAIESLENIKADPLGEINRRSGHNHYAAARREAAGEVVARKADVRPYSHIGDLQQAYDGLRNVWKILKREVDGPPASLTERGLEVLLKRYSEVQALHTGLMSARASSTSLSS